MSALFEMPVRPLSVVAGKDRDVIPLLLGMHAPPNPRILDVTYNRGVMWKGTDYSPHRSDVSREMCPDADTIADCRALPFPDASFDVIAFDPPHLPAAAYSANASGIERRQYGLDASGDYRQGDNINPLFADFLCEARRVLTAEGIVIAKLADLIHNHRYQWQHVAFINAAEALGMTACDVVIKADPAAGNLKSSKWQKVHHFRRGHCYWIVVRPGRRCERRDGAAHTLASSPLRFDVPRWETSPESGICSNCATPSDWADSCSQGCENAATDGDA